MSRNAEGAKTALRKVLYDGQEVQRFTQDSPILPDVWMKFAESIDSGSRVDLLLTPHEESSAAALAEALSKRLDQQQAAARIAYNKGYVVANLTFEETIVSALPLTKWWNQYVWKPYRNLLEKLLGTPGLQDVLATNLRDHAVTENSRVSDLLQMVRLVGTIEVYRLRATDAAADFSEPGIDEMTRAVAALIERIKPPYSPPPYPLWTVSLNRRAEQAIWRSTLAVKADAARQLFSISCKAIRWAVIDSGIDATHPAFRRVRTTKEGQSRYFDDPFKMGTDCESEYEYQTRVERTFDFTRLRRLFDPNDPLHEANRSRSEFQQLYKGLSSGRSIDWQEFIPFLEVKYDAYEKPKLVHGTHVAGVLAADWRKALAREEEEPDDHDLTGVCPDIELYDIRVFDQNGEGDEFGILAALQFIRHLNAHKDQPVIHGVNLSLSLNHDVKNYACGRTPICEECERLSSSGVVVVVAAGNKGYDGGSYRDISITDPGNSENVITVGATHRYRPHTYGVSYFSSRGPTGDGRSKPDLVAPGEKILGPIPGGLSKTMDGTSMAAPHVSGAAALLLARHLELVGQPARVKEILCKTATDLNRERKFQGCGMLDVLRAIQSV